MLPDHSLQTSLQKIKHTKTSEHPPRVLILYGSLRPESYSKKAAQEAGRILESFGAEVKIYDPEGLPVFDRQTYEHPKVQELHELALGLKPWFGRALKFMAI